MESKNTWVIRRQWLSRNTYVTNAKVVFSPREGTKAKGNARCRKRTMTTIVPKNWGERRWRNVIKTRSILRASRKCFIVFSLHCSYFHVLWFFKNINKNCWKTMSTQSFSFWRNYSFAWIKVRWMVSKKHSRACGYVGEVLCMCAPI